MVDSMKQEAASQTCREKRRQYQSSYMLKAKNDQLRTSLRPWNSHDQPLQPVRVSVRCECVELEPNTLVLELNAMRCE